MSEEYSNGYARGYEAGQQSVLKLAEQPAQQEPIAHCEAGPEYCPRCLIESKTTYGSEEVRKPLTDEQIMAIGKELGLKCRLGGNPNIDFDYARAIEAAHGIKENT